MPKVGFMLAIASLLTLCSWAGRIRIAEVGSTSNGYATVQATDYSKIVSIMGAVVATNQTNTYSVGITSVFYTNSVLVTNSYYHIGSHSDVYNSERNIFYNYDSDSTNGALPWLKPGDTVVLTGTTQAFYRVTFESASN
jgi:hypothetical protein